MKVLVVSKYFYPYMGGVESVAFYVAKNLVKRGVEITVIASCAKDQKPGIETVEGIKVIRTPTTLQVGPTPLSFKTFSEVLKQDFDICHLHEPNPFQNLLAYKALLFKRKPVVITYHSDIVPHSLSIRIFKPFYLLFQRLFLFRRAKVIMPTSPYYIPISDILPKFKKKLKVVPNGVDINKFKPSKTKKSKKEKRILFVGRLIYYKGLDYLIGAMPVIQKKVPGTKLVIVGKGPLESEWKQLAKKLGINKNIEWKGKLSDKDMIKEFQNCDVFVLPSIHKTEAFGIVLLEAMACGKPVVTTDVSGTVYAAEGAGIIIKPKQEKELADAIIKILSNKKLAEKYGKYGLKKVKDFTWESASIKTEKIYNKVLKK